MKNVYGIELSVICAICFLFSCFNGSAQPNILSLKWDSVRLETIKIFKERGYLKKEMSNDACMKQIYFYEFSRGVEDDSCGIYGAGVAKSNTSRILILVDSSGWNYETSERLSLQLSLVDKYIQANSINDDMIAVYIKKLIEMYEYNKLRQ